MPLLTYLLTYLLTGISDISMEQQVSSNKWMKCPLLTLKVQKFTTVSKLILISYNVLALVHTKCCCTSASFQLL